MEERIKNGKGLEFVKTELESRDMVKLVRCNWYDIELKNNYNYEYSIVNELTNESISFHHYYNEGMDIEKEAKKMFLEYRVKNIKIIDKVRKWLNTVSP